MRSGAFELGEPLPTLRRPHLFVTLRPWTDVGSVGTLVLGMLEREFNARELGRLHRPGAFYDFTRYRPTIMREGDRRRIDVPTSVVWHARGPADHDYLFLHLLEPHANAEDLIDSVMGLVDGFGVKRHVQIGSMYGSGPHTRPLSVSGSASHPLLQERLERMGVRQSNYQGPTSIMGMTSEMMLDRKLEAVRVTVQLPPYARLDQDHRGMETVLRILDDVYGWGMDLHGIAQEGASEYAGLSRAVMGDPAAQAMVRELEEEYDNRLRTEQPQVQDIPSLSPELERFLRDLEKKDQ